MNSDFNDLLNAFNASDVRYLIVGGHAVMKYTEPRYTKDLDVWIEASPENGAKVFAALAAFGAPLSGLTQEDFSREGFAYQMGRPPARIDILMSVQGVCFSDAWIRRVPTLFDGVPTHVPSLDDLIANKRAVGRPRDLADLEGLLEAKRLSEAPGGASTFS